MMTPQARDFERSVRSHFGGFVMSSRFVWAAAVAAAGVAILSVPSFAADELPAIKTSERNKVPECVTPGRVMAFLKSRNPNLDPRFEKIAVHYMRQGEELGVRWDYAVAQMAIETNYLLYRGAGGRKSDVSPAQNNFAGLGATGRGEPGESFPDVETGVRAHLQHLLLYAGDDVPNPVAERTRKVKEWGILKSFHARIKGPVTFRDLSRKWATNADYGIAIATHARLFYANFCNKPDPAPELVAEARGRTPATQQTAAVESKPERAAPVDKPAAAEKAAVAEKVSGVELARRAIEDGKAEGVDRLRGLGAGQLARFAEPALAATAPKAAAGPQMTVLNAPRPEAENRPERPDTAERAAKAERPAQAEKPAKSEKPAQVMTASAGGLAAKSLPPAVAGTKCRVWTASYGGQRAIIIRSQSDGAINYTVLDVNEGSEKREAEAYIAAYAKGGVVAHEFASQAQALDKAFDLCPEG